MMYRITASNSCDHEIVTADTIREAFRVADALEEYYPDREVKIEEVDA